MINCFVKLKRKSKDLINMESLNIANNYEEAFEAYDQEFPILMQSVRQEEPLGSEIMPNRFLRGLLNALLVSLFIWGITMFGFSIFFN